MSRIGRFVIVVVAASLLMALGGSAIGAQAGIQGTGSPQAGIQGSGQPSAMMAY